ncbi:MAG: glycoside hydrolase family 3 C-terminal domain-containing protein [Clostridiales bacterium]|nr:glycoside hydrolase family 3 C-terminal domain-containing protein [Clostridiales bacterium]
MSKKKKQEETEIAKENKVTLDEVVAGLTLDEKISLVSGKDFWHTVNIDDSPVKIPSVMVSDGPHGLRTQRETADNLGMNDSIVAVCFPSAAGLASSFDTELMKELGETLGEECQAEDVSTILGPAINIKRSPLCGRNFEYFSEDPFAAGKMSAAYINGVQSKNTGVSLKHFAVNNQEKRRFTVSAETDERTLREIYLAGFETAVKEAQPWTVMCSYNRLNGEQVSESKKLLNDILRDEWGFKGAVISDWGAVNDRVKGLKAGLDLEMPGTYGVSGKKIKAAIEDGSLDEAVLDKACRRIINLAFKWTQNRLECTFDREEHHEKAKQAALKTQVLLKNEDGILPLNANKKITFIGEYAKKPRYQGGGSSHINSYKVTDAYSNSLNYASIGYIPGYGVDDTKIDEGLVNDAVAVAADSDVVVIFAGLPESFESEGFDRHHMRLPDCQNHLIERVAEVQKNIVVVLCNGSPVEMPWIDKVKGVLESYLGGEAVGEAQADILFGKANPSGKLAETFPVKLGDTPCYNSFPGTFNTVEYREGIYVGYRYYETFGKEVLFPFGHGLSYTTFKYSKLKLSSKEFTPETGEIEVSLDVANTGKVDGEEVVEIYVSPTEKTVFRSSIELKGFTKVFLKAGETKTVTVKLCGRSFAYYNTDEKDFVCDDGKYIIKAGASVADIRLEDTVTLKGFGVHKNPYSEEVNTVYSTDAREITRSSFEKLLGREITVEIPQKPFTWENCFSDAKDTKWGHVLESVISVVSSKMKMNIGNSEMIYAGAMETPIRTLLAMSNGIVTEDLADALADLISDKKGALLEVLGSGVKLGVGMITKKK